MRMCDKGKSLNAEHKIVSPDRGKKYVRTVEWREREKKIKEVRLDTKEKFNKKKKSDS